MRFKKSILILFIFINIFNIYLLFTPSINAWNNGSYAYNQNDYDYNTDFGSHDWIALNTLGFLYDQNPSAWQWLKDREEIFLVGTEAPDNVNVQMTLDGELLNGFGDLTYHHIYLNEDGTVNEDDSALRSKWCRDNADACYDEGKLEKASYYLGAMTHYIADVSMYSHCAENYVAPYFLNFDEHHSTVEGYVNTRTNNYLEFEEFFIIENFNENILSNSKSTYQITIDLAWDTYKDPNQSNETLRDAVWLHENFFTNWDLTYAQRIAQTNQTKKLYYDRIEENLNNTIKTCIMAMNSIMDSNNPIVSDDDDDNDDDDDDSLRIEGYLMPYIFISLILSFFLIIIKKKGKIKNYEK